MKKDKEQSSFVNIGSSSLLIVFLILCLATFAILSLSSAKSDYSLSEKLAAHNRQYYEASSHAEVVLDKIDRILEETVQLSNPSESFQSSADFLSSSYIRSVTEVLDKVSLDDTSISCILQKEGLIISYKIPAGDKHSLDVELLVTDYTNNENYYKIQKWQINSTSTWKGDNTLNLMPIEKE